MTVVTDNGTLQQFHRPALHKLFFHKLFAGTVLSPDLHICHEKRKFSDTKVTNTYAGLAAALAKYISLEMKNEFL